MKPYEKLVAWQRCHDLTLAIYRLSDSWPAAERYSLTAQIRRASVSAPTNIAEGIAKRGAAELRRFLDISLGSLSELGYLLRLARDLELISTQAWEAVESQRDEAARLTWRLYRSVARRTTRPS